MPSQHSVTEARERLPDLLRAVEAGVTVEIVKDGEAIAVIVPAGAYARMAEAPPDVWDSYRAFCAAYPLDELDLA